MKSVTVRLKIPDVLRGETSKASLKISTEHKMVWHAPSQSYGVRRELMTCTDKITDNILK